MRGQEEQKDEDECFTTGAAQGPKASPKPVPRPPREKPSGAAPGPMGPMGKNIYQKAVQMSPPEQRLVPRHFVCSGRWLEGVS